MGIEPTLKAWKALVLPLNYTRKFFIHLSVNTRNIITYFLLFVNNEFKLYGGPDGNRTRDLLRDRQAC